MGWSRGTEVFDTVVGELLNPNVGDKKRFIKSLINVLWDLDWDNICESEYYTHPFIRECLIELDPSYEEYLEDVE